MKTAMVIAGIVILIAGLGILVYGVYYQSNQTTITQVVPFSERVNTDAGGTWVHTMKTLQAGETVNGTAQILSYNQSAGPVFLYIQNESAYIYWGGCAPCSLPSLGYSNLENYTLPSNGVKSFSWTAPYSGSFYFIFDNENYNQVANATFAATGTTTSTVTGNTTLVLGGLAVAVVGVIVAVVGLSMVTRPASPKTS
jgi:hypothetical protein